MVISMNRRVVKKLLMMYIVFVLMVVTGIISLVSGIILWLSEEGRFREGLQHGRYVNNATEGSRNVVLRLGRGLWRDIHMYSSLACVGIVVVHILFNWRWITSATKAVLR